METPDPDDDGEPISTPRPPWFDWLKWIIPALGVLILVILVVTLSGGGDDQTENAVQNPVAQEQPATDDADTGQQEQDLVAIPDQGQTTDEEPDSAETDENTQNAVPGADVDEGEGENTAGGNDNEGVDPDEEAAEQETKLGLLIAQLQDLQGRAVGVATFLVGLGVPETQAVAFVGGAFNDPIRDLIYSISRILVARDDPSVDIATAWAIDTILGTGAHTLLYNNSVYECGAEDPVRVVCPDNVEDVPEGSVLVIAAEMDGTVGMAANPTDQFVYGFVADTDGDPANDWIPQGDFDWDYFGGTDTWYQVFIDGSGATMTRTDATTFEQLPTAARAIIIDKTILFVVPTEELGGDLSTVSWRVTAFVHDGTFQPEVSAGDVLGANPTEPLYPIGDNVVEVTVESVEQGQADLEEFLEELAAEE